MSSGNTTKIVVPSLPASTFEALRSLATVLKGTAPELQVDIVDGQFVPSVSWPFTETDVEAELERLSQFTDDYLIEMDCMILAPEQFLDLFVSLGVARVIIHMGSTENYIDIITHARTHGYKIGLALTNDRPLDELGSYINDIDFVQLMGIATVGKQGQPFDERTLPRAIELRAKYPELEIAVDGSVNKKTIQRLDKAGVNRFAPGSAVAKATDPKEAYNELVKLVA